MASIQSKCRLVRSQSPNLSQSFRRTTAFPTTEEVDKEGLTMEEEWIVDDIVVL
jgi:hypothetical protein